MSATLQPQIFTTAMHLAPASRVSQALLTSGGPSSWQPTTWSPVSVTDQTKHPRISSASGGVITPKVRPGGHTGASEGAVSSFSGFRHHVPKRKYEGPLSGTKEDSDQAVFAMVADDDSDSRAETPYADQPCSCSCHQASVGSHGANRKAPSPIGRQSALSSPLGARLPTFSSAMYTGLNAAASAASPCCTSCACAFVSFSNAQARSSTPLTPGSQDDVASVSGQSMISTLGITIHPARSSGLSPVLTQFRTSDRPARSPFSDGSSSRVVTSKDDKNFKRHRGFSPTDRTDFVASGDSSGTTHAGLRVLSPAAVQAVMMDSGPQPFDSEPSAL